MVLASMQSSLCLKSTTSVTSIRTVPSVDSSRSLTTPCVAKSLYLETGEKVLPPGFRLHSPQTPLNSIIPDEVVPPWLVLDLVKLDSHE